MLLMAVVVYHGKKRLFSSARLDFGLVINFYTHSAHEVSDTNFLVVAGVDGI